MSVNFVHRHEGTSILFTRNRKPFARTHYDVTIHVILQTKSYMGCVSCVSCGADSLDWRGRSWERKAKSMPPAGQTLNIALSRSATRYVGLNLQGDTITCANARFPISARGSREGNKGICTQLNAHMRGSVRPSFELEEIWGGIKRRY